MKKAVIWLLAAMVILVLSFSMSCKAEVTKETAAAETTAA
jgi:hypothetical protein